MNEEIKHICIKCQEHLYCQGKGCAFRSLGNEYCDEVENANKLINDLRKQNTELKEKINTYENPEDLTLMFMYCDEKAKDKIKELKDNWNKLKEWLEEMINEIKTNDIYDRTEYQCTQIATLESTLAKMQEIEGGMNEQR